MLTPVSMELSTPPLELKMPRAVATTVWPSSSSSSSSRALGLKGGASLAFEKVPTINRRPDHGPSLVWFLPHRDGFGHGVDVVVVLVLGAVVHGASEGIHTAVVVCVLGLGGYMRLQWAGAAALHTEHSSVLFSPAAEERCVSADTEAAGPDPLFWSCISESQLLPLIIKYVDMLCCGHITKS